MPTVLHIALYTFKSSLSATEIDASTASMLSLQTRCIHPRTGKPYIKSMTAGPNLRRELGYAGGWTHALVMEFENEEDWRFYTTEDPVHTEFMETNGDWEGGIVTDVRGA